MTMIPLPGSEPLAISTRCCHLPRCCPRLARKLSTCFAAPWALVVFGLILTPVGAQAGDWPLPRADLQATGSIADSLPEQLSVRWEYKGDNAFEAPVVIAGDKLFAADANGLVYSIDAATGKELWRVDTELGFTVSPAVHEDLLVVGDVDGVIYALDTATGERRWEAKTKAEISGAASFYGDLVLITSQDGKLYALSVKNGTNVWTYETSDQIRCSPTIAGDRTFLGGCDGNLHSVRLADGKAAASPLPLGGPTGSTPAVVGEYAYLPIMDGVVLAFDWQQNKEIWRHEDEERAQEYRSSAAVNDRLVIVSSQNKQVDALERTTGKRVWRYTLRRRADGSPIIAGDDCWIASTDGRLIRISLADGKEKWSFEIGGQFIAGPSIANGLLFIPDNKGVIRCFGSR